MIAGVIRDSGRVHERKVSVNPVAHHYEAPGERPYIKYSCPVCEAVGNRAQISKGIKSCPLCGVSLNWDRNLKKGDVAILCRPYGPQFGQGTRVAVVGAEDAKYVLEKDGRRITVADGDALTVLDPVEV